MVQTDSTEPQTQKKHSTNVPSDPLKKGRTKFKVHNRNCDQRGRGARGRPRVPAVPASRGRQVGVLRAAVILCVRGVTSQWPAGCPGRTRRRSDRIIERRGSEAAGAAHASDAEYARACHGTRARTDWHQLCAADCVTTPRRSWHAVTDSPCICTGWCGQTTRTGGLSRASLRDRGVLLQICAG